MGAMDSFITDRLSKAHSRNISKRAGTVLLTCFVVLAVGFYLFLDQDRPSTTTRILLCDFYITVAEDSDVTKLTMYTKVGESPPDSNTVKLIEKDGKKMFHFAVSYQPDTIYTLGGGGITSYEVADFDKRTASLDLYLDGSGKISFCGKTECDQL